MEAPNRFLFNLDMHPKYEFLKQHAMTGLVLIAVIALYWSSSYLQEIFIEFAGAIKEYESGHVLQTEIAFVILGAISAMLSPFSSAPLIPFAVAIWGKTLTTALLFIGWMIGGALTYLLGDKIGYHVLKNYVTIDEAITSYRRHLNPSTEFTIVLLFRLSMPAEIPGYVLGTIRYNFWKYLLATGIAELPFAVLTVYAGGAVLDKNPYLLAGMTVAIITILSGAFYLFHKKLNHNNTVQ